MGTSFFGLLGFKYLTLEQHYLVWYDRFYSHFHLPDHGTVQPVNPKSCLLVLVYLAVHFYDYNGAYFNQVSVAPCSFTTPSPEVSSPES